MIFVCFVLLIFNFFMTAFLRPVGWVDSAVDTWSNYLGFSISN